MSAALSFPLWMKHNRFAIVGGIFVTSTVVTALRINEALKRNQQTDDTIAELDSSIDQLRLIEQQKQKRVKQEAHAIYAQPLTTIVQSVSHPKSSWTRWLWPVNWFRSSPSAVDQSLKLSICDSPIKLSALQSLSQPGHKSVDKAFIVDVISQCDELFHTGSSEQWRAIQQSISQSVPASAQLLPVTLLNAYQQSDSNIADISEIRAITVSGSKTSTGKKIMM